MALSTVSQFTMRRLAAGPLGLRGLVTGTATDEGSTTVQSATVLADTRNGLGLKDTAQQPTRFSNAILALWANSTSTALATSLEEASILSYTPSTGAVEVGRTFAATPVTGATRYEIHTHGLQVAELHDALNFACRNALRGVHTILAGLVTDGDMQASAASDWTASTATLSKVTTEANVGWAERALKVVTTAANGYASCTPVLVYEGEYYHLFVLVQTESGTSDVVVRDLTNSAAITVSWADLSSVAAADGRDWRWMVGRFETPSGCNRLEIRLRNQSDASTSYFGLCALYANSQRYIDLPTWLTDPYQQILDVYTLAIRERGRLAARLEKLRPLYPPEGNPTGQTAWRLPIPAVLSRPVVLLAERGFSEFSAETDTVPTYAQDWLLAGAVWQAYEMGAQPRGMDTKEVAAQRDRALTRWQNWCANQNPRNRYGNPVFSR